MDPLNLGTKKKTAGTAVKVTEIGHEGAVIWLLCCLIGCVLPIGLALAGQMNGDKAAMGCLALVSIGMWPMLARWMENSWWVFKGPALLGLFALGSWFSLSSVGIMSNERGLDLAKSATTEAAKLFGSSHRYEKPPLNEPRWIKPGSQPLPVPLEALLERMRKDGKLSDP